MYEDYEDSVGYEEEDLDLEDLDLDELLVPPHIRKMLEQDTTVKELGPFNMDKDYVKFLRTYFSSFFARKMVSSFTRIGAKNQILSCNSKGSLLDESSSGYLVSALYTFKKYQGYLDRLYSDLLLANSRAVYLLRITNLLTHINKYSDNLLIKRHSNTTIVGMDTNHAEPEITKDNYLATMVTSQFILRNIHNVYTQVSELQTKTTGDYTFIPIDVSKIKKISPYAWYELDIHPLHASFQDMKQYMTLVWLDGADLPSIREFLNKQKSDYKLQIVARVYNEKYIKYAVEYEDDNVVCTITRPNLILYPNTIT